MALHHLLRAVPLRYVGWVLGVPVLLAVAWFNNASIIERVAVVLGAVAVVLLVWQARRARWTPTSASSGSAWLPRTRGNPSWVYVYTEWRDERTDRVLPPTFRHEPRPDGAVLHLVYIGTTVDLDRRTEEHGETAPWRHDWLMIETRTFGSPQDAEFFERAEIERCAQAPWRNLQPRENRRHNPSYDPEYAARMRQLAFA